MIKNVLATVAAAGLLLAPIAAQAGTRAADSGVSMDAMARAAAPVDAAEYDTRSGGLGTVWWVAGFALVGLALVTAITSGANTKSPGT